MRPIDADAIIPMVYAGCDEYSIQDLLDEEPTLDYAPVQHAHWVDFTVPYVVVNQVGENWASNMKKTKCSLCGKTNKAYHPPFCPHCGAKMDGDTE